FTRHLFRYERQRSIICEPIAYAKALDLIMRTARIAFSESFIFLLEMLSLIIGEDQKVVYAFFLMVEMLYINCQTINELKELIEDRHELITCVQVCSLNCPPDQAEVKLRRVDEDVDSADYRYEILKFGDFMQCMARQHGTFMLHNRHIEGNKRMGRKRRATTSMDAKLRGLHGLRRTIVSRRQRRLTTTSETQGNRRDESEGSPPSSLPKILYSEDEQGYSEREQQTNPQNTTSDQAVGSRFVNSECCATSGYTLQGISSQCTNDFSGVLWRNYLTHLCSAY
uniref:Uncharacterized protein n=1 Tax=Parascaris univalens TaxID=6257 RepID=A0A915C728_PARUN